jgi:hypothetical protein
MRGLRWPERSRGEGAIADERLDHIGEQAGDVVVEPARRQRLPERDRPGGQHGAVVRRVEEHDVAADAVVLRAGEAGIGIQHLLDRQDVVVAVAAGGGDDLGMRRRAEMPVITIEFQPCGAVIGETEIADDLAFDPFGDPGDGAVIAVRHAAVGAAGLEPLGDEADAHQLLRRPAEIFP